jgi:hypothetical protein
MSITATTFTLPEALADDERRTVTYRWEIDQEFPGEPGSITEVSLDIRHDKARKRFTAYLTRNGITRERGYAIRHAHIQPGEMILINREPAARYSRKRLYSFADESAALFLGILAGNGNPDHATSVYEVANGRNYLGR